MHNTYIQIMAIPMFQTRPHILREIIAVYVCGRYE